MCDEDALLRDMVEAVTARTGHDVVGLADSSAGAVGLIGTARPDVVVLDLLLGYDTDFDIIESAIEVGARVVVFSRYEDTDLLERYDETPMFVLKPDLIALEEVLRRLEVDEQHHEVVAHERRARPTVAAAGPPSTGIGDAQAFFEALNEASPGDGMISLEVGRQAETVAADATQLLRGGDRLLLFPTAVRFFLPGAGEEGIQSLVRRLSGVGAIARETIVTSVIVAEGELGADAFTRLKHHGERREV